MSKNPSKTVNYLFAFDLLVKRRTFSFLASQLLAVRLVSVLIFCCQKEHLVIYGYPRRPGEFRFLCVRPVSVLASVSMFIVVVQSIS